MRGFRSRMFALNAAKLRFSDRDFSVQTAARTTYQRFSPSKRQRDRRNINRVCVALVDELVAADGDWDRIDKICVVADWSPRDAISMALTRDRELAERMLISWL